MFITRATFCLFASPHGNGFLCTKDVSAFDYAKFYSRSHDVVIRVYDEAGNMIETHEHAGDFREFYRRPSLERGACITGVQPSVATPLPHLTAFPASQDRARIAFDWRMIKMICRI